MAGRKPSVRYWESRGGYCCWINGVQHLLAKGPKDEPHGPAYTAAVREYARLICSPGERPAANNSPSVRLIAERYLAELAEKVENGDAAERTLTVKQIHLQTFCNRQRADGLGLYGELPVDQLRPYHVLDFCREMSKAGRGKLNRKMGWTNGTKRIAIVTISAAINLAKKRGYIVSNPLAGMERPPARSRGAEILISPEVHQQALALASPYLRDVLVVLEGTGCRPGEIQNAEAQHFDKQQGCLVFHAKERQREGETFTHKTGRKGKDRIIVLRGEALAVVERLVAEYPTGRLFRYRKQRRKDKGKVMPWGGHTLINEFQTIAHKLKVRRFCAYGYRHSFCTAWLKSGRSIEVLADLVGNSPNTLRLHYAHLLADRANLGRAVEAFRAEMEAERTGTAQVLPFVGAAAQ